ncbi:hypothetical protein TWF730_003097 [Orbilia blumenaviensis]|uniref:Uncharacterized protein n=1 Tax=Orbilia blumenaviensis TaxID=1796055 RepID=A0AAV9U4C9_9PEZI
MSSRSRSRATKKSRRSSLPPTFESRDEGRDFFTTRPKHSNAGVVGRLQGVEDILFGAVGELGRMIIGDKKGAQKSAEVFEDGVETLFGRRRNSNSRAVGSLTRQDVDICLLRDTYFEGYDAGIHAGLSRAEAEVSWYNRPRQIGNGRAVILSEQPPGNVEALKQGPSFKLGSSQI